MNTNLKTLTAAISFIAVLSLPQLGCCTRKQSTLLQTNGNPGELSVKPSATASVQRARVEVQVHFLETPSPFSFSVEDHDVGTNERTLIQWLQNRSVTHVVFKSEYKLTSERVDEFMNLFSAAGIVVSEFWVPVSHPPGRVNLLVK